MALEYQAHVYLLSWEESAFPISFSGYLQPSVVLLKHVLAALDFVVALDPTEAGSEHGFECTPGADELQVDWADPTYSILQHKGLSDQRAFQLAWEHILQG